LNLSVERVRELKQVYVAAGMAAEDAFDAAVIAAGKEKIELLGNAADTTAGQMKIFEAGVKNAQDEFKVELVRAFADGIADIAGNSDDAAQSLEAAAAGAGTLLGTLAAGTLGNLGVAMGDNLAIDFAVQRGEIDALEGAFRKFWGRQTPELKAQIELWAEMAEEYRQMGALSPEVAKDWRRGEAVISSAVDDMGDAAMRTIPKLSALLGTLGFISQAQWDFAVENGTNERRAPAEKTGPRARSLRMAGVNLDQVARGLDDLDLGFSEIGRDVDEVTGGFGGWSGKIEDATSALDELAMASGDLFGRLRGQKDFNLAEELFGLGDKAGWSALDMSKFGVTSGLFDQARADELLNQSYLLQSAEQLIAAGMKGDELWAAIQGLQGQDGLAQKHFGELDAAVIEPDMGLNTDPAWLAFLDLQTNIDDNPLRATLLLRTETVVPPIGGGSGQDDRPIPAAPVGGIPNVPSTGGPVNPQPQGAGNVTINAYNERTAALAMTMLAQMRRNGVTA
jgi:hypothetical protein